MDKIVFFDVDETIINEKSMFTIIEYLDKKIDFDFSNHLKKIRKMSIDGVEREKINRYYYHIFKGIPAKLVETYSTEFFLNKISKSNDFFINPSINIMNFFRKIGFKIVLISGSSTLILQPISQYLKVDHVLATKQVIDQNGILTGEIIGQPVIGEGKRTAILEWAKQKHIDLNLCIGIGDHISDFSFLELMGFPLVLNGDKELENIARQYHWCIIEKGNFQDA